MSVTGKVPSHLAHRMGLISFTSSLLVSLMNMNGDGIRLIYRLDRTSSALSSLQAKFADYPCEELNAKYEIVSQPVPPSGSAPAQNPMSSFAR